MIQKLKDQFQQQYRNKPQSLTFILAKIYLERCDCLDILKTSFNNKKLITYELGKFFIFKPA